jgi:hypothetical protein
MQLRDHGISRQADYSERRDAFAIWFDIDVDPATALPQIVKRLGLSLERIVGAEPVVSAFKQLGVSHQDWREGVDEVTFYIQTDLGKKLTALSAYAVFGLLDRDEEALIADTIQLVEDLLTDCPADQWLQEPEREPLLPTIAMARSRWNLDNGYGLEPEGLALLGGVKITRIRNMMSGNQPDLPKDPTGLLSNEAARAWLEGRDCFLPTLIGQPQADAVDAAEDAIDPIFLPVARDGTLFTPETSRGERFQIGDKGSERYYDNFDEALAALQTMPVAKWRRPNPQGNWGIVSAVEWRRVDRSTLKQLS